MKTGPVTKLDKRNTPTLKLKMTSFQQIVINSIYGQFGTIQKPDSGCMLCKFYIFINSNLLSYKNSKTELKNL